MEIKFEKYIFDFVTWEFQTKTFQKVHKEHKNEKIGKKCLYYEYEEWSKTNDFIPYA